jgi:23S rRNA (uracil1939-C5)-methyltransferase
MIRTGFSTKEVMVVLVLNDEYEFDYNNLIKEFPMIKTIVLNINNKNTNVVLSNINKVIYGEGFITDILGDYKFIISPNSFYQVNPIQTLAIYNKAIELANLKDNETIVDLYCGIGTIGIFASKYVQKVYGIEIVPEAILNAKENAKSNNINNIEFILGDVEKAFDEFISNKQEKIDTIFLDPPRKGCDNKTIENIIKIKPEKVVYISCNPATLARDLHMLENDYDIKVVQPIDNFPYTNHIESVSVLEKKVEND